MAAYEGAIDYLDEKGMIDRARVGILGFSRTVWKVEYTLTHSKAIHLLRPCLRTALMAAIFSTFFIEVQTLITSG